MPGIYKRIIARKELTDLISLEKNWDEIRSRVILPLWNRRFKSMFESAKLDYDDFESLAGIELTKAIKTFNPEKSNLFTYSTKVITQKAMTELRDCTQRDKRKALYVAESVDALDNTIVERLACNTIDDDLSEKMKTYLGKLSKLQREVLFAMSEGYTNEEIVEGLKITPKEMTEACSAIKSYRNVSILF